MNFIYRDMGGLMEMAQPTQQRPLPVRVEQRLSDLVRMDEFQDYDVEYCRQTYWDNRDDWHQILINCFNDATKRIEEAKKNG